MKWRRKNNIWADNDIPSWNKFLENLYEMATRTIITYGPMFPEHPPPPRPHPWNGSVVETSLIT